MEAIAALRSIQADSVQGANTGSAFALCITHAATSTPLSPRCTFVGSQGAHGAPTWAACAGYVAEAIAAGWPYAWHCLGVRPPALAFVALVARHALAVAGLWPRSGPGSGLVCAPGACPAQPLSDASALAGRAASRFGSAASTVGQGANPEGLGAAGGVAARAAMQGDQPGMPCSAAHMATGTWPDSSRPSAEALPATGLHVQQNGDAAAAEPDAASAAAAGRSPKPWDPLAELAAARSEEARATLKWLIATLPEGCDMSCGQARARQQPCELSMPTAASACAGRAEAKQGQAMLFLFCTVVCLELCIYFRLRACIAC